jgi:hypothetical protein
LPEPRSSCRRGRRNRTPRREIGSYACASPGRTACARRSACNSADASSTSRPTILPSFQSSTTNARSPGPQTSSATRPASKWVTGRSTTTSSQPVSCKQGSSAGSGGNSRSSSPARGTVVTTDRYSFAMSRTRPARRIRATTSVTERPPWANACLPDGEHRTTRHEIDS